eukprot:CAMPEP_0182430594 /NCGR_PEP_ID=MMETSP1167-20130531/41900_1 /TAXON_ID=2988 /ORGANISM="Mallomonas Sp, Strain CCMP3275" /LENGTH=531 /DNA_ID=CAMNT_0024615883 /DNA_START=44 /DNA_END=1642 /DNA_ORIENTATION=+
MNQASSAVNTEESNCNAAGNFERALAHLAPSVVPNILPSREFQCECVSKFIRKAIVNYGGEKPLYLSGQPGCGKTATVLCSVAQIQREVENQKLPKFKFLHINCISVINAKDTYSLLWKKISGEKVHNAKALKSLTEYFVVEKKSKRARTTALDAESSPLIESVGGVFEAGEDEEIGQEEIVPEIVSDEGDEIDEEEEEKEDNNFDGVTVCLLDEVDFLIMKEHNVMFNLLNWSMGSSSGLALICIANVSDLPDRLSLRLRSRFGSERIDRIAFEPYTFHMTLSVYLDRLKDLPVKIFKDDAINLCARRCCVINGDMRTALKICSAAIETHLLAHRQHMQLGESLPPIDSATVWATVEEYKSNPLMTAVSHCCLLEKVLLIIMLKYSRTICDGPIRIRELWGRLRDMLGAPAGVVDDGKTCWGPMRLPSFSIFRANIMQMVDSGLLTFHKPIKKNWNRATKQVVSTSLVRLDKKRTWQKTAEITQKKKSSSLWRQSLKRRGLPFEFRRVQTTLQQSDLEISLKTSKLLHLA